jgi:hypothetical protein
MFYECINPGMGDEIREIMEGSIEEIAAFDFGSPGDIWEARRHWNSCPACRNEFPSLPAVLEQAGHKMDQVFAASLCLMKDHFLTQKTSLATAVIDGDAYPKMIAALANAEGLVHEELVHALGTATTLYRGADLEFDPSDRPLLSYCREFISSLEPDVQRFVFASTLCFELLRPMWEKVGLPPREDPRTPAELFGLPPSEEPYTVDELLAGLKARPVQEPVSNLQERLQQAIADSGLEPKVLWETIDAAASAHVAGREATGPQPFLQTWITQFEENFDNFSESMKATQNEAVRLSERSIRKAADYGPEVAARIGPSLYSQLHEKTQQQLNAAEFLYDLNRQEPRFAHGPAINLALACETELNLQLTWPILKELVDSGTRHYRAATKPGEKSQPPLIDRNQIQGRNMTLGRIGYYLGNHPDFSDRARARGFDPNAISRQVLEVVTVRDRAAHYPVCELADVDKLRSLIFRSDGILSCLHPATTDNSIENVS